MKDYFTLHKNDRLIGYVKNNSYLVKYFIHNMNPLDLDLIEDNYKRYRI